MKPTPPPFDTELGAVLQAMAAEGCVRASGYGRFGGRWGIEAFSNTRWVTIATQQAHYPF
ncbi:hypothetical protein E0500_023000 [Streptomyces sp. KM273126]|uniref:hypothetical protein n=1 Tax=Streptomyces sp. KM273126 TaxID=2545247 RepID=UPI00103EC4B6|nr:hypothetical protein [Streptomyces sp. KM273126]MBA2810186.1 hypothetical protein [Streptomyces sp. KM273126]